MTLATDTLVKLPEILNIPEKLHPIIRDLDKYRYFLIEGGRGGGKSHAVARLILYLCERYNLRVVCGREIQKSINESVYSLMADLIRKFQLHYEVFSTKINHKEKDSTINFRGFREQGAFNIQGMEGVDIPWIDEAQALTKQTLDVLIPTIRKENAKIFFTMNRHVADDPVYEMFAHRDDCLHIHLDYFDNKFCTQALIKEAEECKKKSMQDYNHIWLGIPLDKSEDVVFGHSELQEAKKAKYPLRPSYGLRLGGFDIARFGDDKSACVAIQQMGALHWEVVHCDEWDKKDLNYTTGRILTTSRELELTKSNIDADGLGAGPLDSLREGRGYKSFEGFRNLPIGFKDDPYYANVRTQAVYKLKDMIQKGHLCIPFDDLIKELLTLRYGYDNYQRKRLISKDLMRKDGIKSPNLADALIMAVALVGEVKYEQSAQYYSQPAYSAEGDLFKIGGVK